MRGFDREPSGSGSPEDRHVLRVTVLCGGPSAEREVSLASGQAVADALRRCGHQVFVADIGPHNLQALEHPADVVFPALHGTFGEDGTVQRILEAREIAYVGSDSRASARAMDKVITKRLAIEAGIDTPAFEVWEAQTLGQCEVPELPLPLVVKPVDQGSSVATRIVHEQGALRPALEVAVGKFGRAVVEQFIVGDELTVGIIGDQPLPPICVRPKRAFYDYAAKYEDGATEYLFESGHSAELLARAQELSMSMFARLGCRHLARVDWMTDARERLWLLEVNTLPGFTVHSLVPKAAAHIGIGFDELVEQLVQMAWSERR